MKTPLEMKEYATTYGVTEWQDGLTVSPEGEFFLSGRRVTLNEAIVYQGTRRQRRESGELARLGLD